MSKCKEFSDVKLRVNEKRILNGLNKDKNKLTIRYHGGLENIIATPKIGLTFTHWPCCYSFNRFPVNGKIKSSDQKVSWYGNCTA